MTLLHEKKCSVEWKIKHRDDCSLSHSELNVDVYGGIYLRVSMGLPVSRKTAKNLAVRRKNERIVTVSRKKMLTVKRSNHKIRSRDPLLTLMCYAFMCSGNLRSYWEQQIHVVIGRENYYRDQKCRKCLHNFSDRRFDSSTIFTTFCFLSSWLVAMAVLKGKVSLYCAGKEKPIERCMTRFKVAEENKLFSSFQKKILSSLIARKMVSQAIQTC